MIEQGNLAGAGEMYRRALAIDIYLGEKSHCAATLF
jgi:hypothetical protein